MFFFLLLFSVDCTFAAQEIQANQETLVKISAAGESESYLSVITENWTVIYKAITVQKRHF